MAKKKFSDLPATTSIGASDLLATSQVDADAQSGYTSKKITGGNVARSINAGIEYPTDLETEDKTIIGAINEINSNALAIDSASGDIASFDTAISAPLVSLSTTIVAKGGGGTPQQKKPIVGYSEVNQTRRGINQWNEEPESGVYQTANGEPAPDANSWRSKDFIRVTPDTSYHFHKGGNQNVVVLYFYEDDGTYINYQWVNANVSDDFNFTTPANCAYMHFTLYNAASGYGLTYNHDISVSYPNTETQYIPYNGQTITIALGQTVYGGRLYFENGWKCEVTHAKKMFTGASAEQWYTYHGGSPEYYQFTTPISDSKNSQNAVTNMFKLITAGERGTANGLVKDTDKNFRFALLPSENITDEATWRSFLSNNNLEICYELSTPFTIDLSSSDMLDAVVGKNNVFSDCGVTSLTFIDKMQHYVDKKIAELQALILQ